MALNTRQKAFIEALVENPMLPYYTVGRMYNMPQTTLERWKKLPEFQEALDARLKENFAEGTRAAMETMLSLCREGDFKAAEFILKNFGYNPTNKVEAQVEQTTTIKVDIEE